MNRGCLKIRQVNANCWATLRDIVLPGCSAHIVAAQEVRLWQTEMEDAANWAKSNGWRLFALPCTSGPKGGRSAGVLLLFKAFLDVDPALLCDVATEVAKHRSIAIPMRIKGLGCIMVYSVYLESGTGMGDFNTKLLESLSRHAMSHGHPYIMLGDWNLKPSDVECVLKSNGLKVSMKYTDTPTYVLGQTESLLDDAAIDHRIDGQLATMGVAQCAMGPHKPVDYE